MDSDLLWTKTPSRKLDDKRELALKQDKSDDDRKKLAELNDELGRLDFSETARDPLYREFVRAITAAANDDPSLKEAAPPTDLWKKRQEIAKDIAKHLLEVEPKA